MNHDLKKMITLIITVYKNEKQDIDFWLKFHNENKDILNINFIIDQEKCPKNLEKLNGENCLYINGENLGQFWSVYNHIKDGNVNTPYFKVVDPDDRISLTNMRKINFGNGEEIISFAITRGEKLSQINEEQITMLLNGFVSKNSPDNFANSYTILPTCKIFNDELMNKWRGTRVNMTQDQLLGFIALCNGASVVKDASKFYYYSKNSGQTRIDNTIYTLQEAVKTYSIIREIITETKLAKFSDWPYEYKWETEMAEKYLKIFPEERNILKSKLEKLKMINIYNQNNYG